MKKWLCVICGLIYDEAEGWPDDGIAPGTRWEDVPEDWTCPDCGVGKEDFEMIEIDEDDEPIAAVASAPAAAAVAAPEVTHITTEITSNSAPIIIIGSGYAGYGLAEALRKKNPEQAIRVFTRDDGADYNKPGLSNALARGKTVAELVMSSAEEKAQTYNIEIVNHCRVQAIRPDEQLVVTDNGEQPYSKLVLATGAEPVKLPLAGDGVDDIISVNSLTDYRLLRERLDSGSVRKISIIGNGLVGCEFANELAVQGYEVSVIGLTDCLDVLLPQAISDDLQQKLTEQGVAWYLQNTVQSVSANANANANANGKGYQLTLSQGQTLEADLVLSAAGLQPCTELATAAGLECRRGIVVDDSLQTSAPAVFALGDCSEVNGQVLPYIAPITHGLKALSATLSGQPTPVNYPLMPVVVKTPALPLLVLPPPPGAQGAWQVEDTGEGMRALFTESPGQPATGFVLSGKLVTRERQQRLDDVSMAPAGRGTQS